MTSPVDGSSKQPDTIDRETLLQQLLEAMAMQETKNEELKAKQARLLQKLSDGTLKVPPTP